VADIPAVKLFKSFTTTLKTVDPSINILPFHSSKQRYSSLTTLKQIQSMEDNKLGQFFKSYHPKQHYSISGYFHISSTLSFDEITKKTSARGMARLASIFHEIMSQQRRRDG
jgi:hypothetical protein